MTDNTPLRPILAMTPKPKPAEEEKLTPEQMEELQKEAEQLSYENTCKLVSIALLEAALRYRQGFYIEESERFEETVMAEFKAHKNYKHPGWARKWESFYKKQALDYRNKQETFNKTLEKEIKVLTDSLKESSLKKFDDFSTSFGLIAEELLKAKSKKDFHIICQMYNMGYMEQALKEIKEIENQHKNQSHETTEPEQKRDTLADITDRYRSSGLQEGSNLSIVTNNNESEPDSNANDHHQPYGSPGEVQDDSRQQQGGDGHLPGDHPDLP